MVAKVIVNNDKTLCTSLHPDQFNKIHSNANMHQFSSRFAIMLRFCCSSSHDFKIDHIQLNSAFVFINIPNIAKTAKGGADGESILEVQRKAVCIVSHCTQNGHNKEEVESSRIPDS